ncbi:MAG TPA: ComEA family DNA-binding protein [Mycobacteriales bacterium]|nr:ComEA family DNA-binding protein [Mycobacteriales bacterium]
MSDSIDVPSADRLTAIGLPPRAVGWVPDQPPAVRPAAVDDAVPEAAVVAAPATVLDNLRLALAARLPGRLSDRLQQASTRVFATGLAVLAVAVVMVALKLHGHQAPSFPEDYSGPSYSDGPTASAPADPATDGSSIVVDVGGRVRRPGLVTLPLGARVADAIRAAGGPLHRRELRRTDLAARVTDGQLLMVGTRAAAATPGGSAAPVSLSTASLEELETLPGVGPVTAQKIIDWRTTHGGFTSVSQLQQVSGIGPARYSQLSPLVTP